MIKHSEILQLCRLCLVKEKVNHSIFEESGDLLGILLKITSCLPVSISQDDSLPKRICETCYTKLDSYYKFWNDSANAEKKLLQWLSQTTLGTISKTGQGDLNKSRMDKAIIKEETIDLEDGKLDSLEMSTDAKTYILQQQQLPYSVATPKILPSETNETDEPASKRPRRASAIKALEHMESEDEDDDLDDGADAYAKAETDDSDKEDENYQEGPSTSMDDQPGPSGVGKGTTEASNDKDPADVCEIKMEEVDIPYSCPQCSKGFQKKIRLKKHLLSHSQERPFECEICNKKFKRKYEVTVHSRVHTNELSFQCEFCLKVLRSKGSLSTHRKRHLKEYVAKCEVCGAGFVTKQEYQNHVGSKHGQSIHVCDICNRPCYDKAALQSHRARHEEGYETNTKYRCELCNKTFLQEKYLKHHHMRIHKNGGQRYICDHCGKRVNSKRSLRDHLLIHKGLRPVECPQCDKKFALKTTLNLHLRTHSGERPYKCEDCGKCFTQRSSFKTHVRYHTGERPYKCEFCDQAFVSKGAMTLHIRSKH